MEVERKSHLRASQGTSGDSINTGKICAGKELGIHDMVNKMLEKSLSLLSLSSAAKR